MQVHAQAEGLESGTLARFQAASVWPSEYRERNPNLLRSNLRILRNPQAEHVAVRAVH